MKWQNLFLLIASYIFYGWWDVKFLILIFISTLTDYYTGLKIATSENHKFRKSFLILSIFVNLGMLFGFKYFNFFIDNFNRAFTLFGSSFDLNTLDIILPVGISFYTFQTISYTIDIYRRKIEPTSDFIAFSAFVSFFPQLVAGPIERAKNLLPQFENKRKFEFSQGIDGLRQILWGLFKKLVIADNCAVFVNYIFENSADLSGSTLLLGAVLFIFQIYGDFSGYSDIAIGTARLFGFNLMQNFAFPLFSRDIPEFWRRWHISLTTWFRDYLYIPLSRRGSGNFFRIRNIFILFLITGFWHGAKWTFIAWGALNAIYFLPYLLIRRVKSNKGIVAEHSIFPNLKEIYQVTRSFVLAAIGIIFFRASDIQHAINYLIGIFDESLFTLPYYRGLGYIRPLIILIIFFMVVEWFGRRNKYALELVKSFKFKSLRRAFYFLIILLIGLYMWSETNDFIYFQF
ncbi:MBOAT family O-acyltransferase [Christiangramia sp. SM2212]|uniref:MBOAT family O-acyltransferase n=1 Tax=Christiangramia sediminicola TaxID=3073267 RepID=UPI00286918F1|nr:MBOAT family O-acyltransferase [Christiangramia sp. SM2212]